MSDIPTFTMMLFYKEQLEATERELQQTQDGIMQLIERERLERNSFSLMERSRDYWRQQYFRSHWCSNELLRILVDISDLFNDLRGVPTATCERMDALLEAAEQEIQTIMQEEDEETEYEYENV
nr:hypothetical protein [Cressdnaviricota sp.]